jgi:outer membrane receptor protein involved in Fe transport
MKQIYFLTLFLFSFVLFSCGPVEEITRNNDDRGRYADQINIETSGVTLDQYIKRLNGVRVVGEGRKAVIQIRGVASFELSTEPLFVIDGMRMGNEFSRIYDMINISDIKSVEVLTSSRATLLFGNDGFSGAILITKNDS